MVRTEREDGGRVRADASDKDKDYISFVLDVKESLTKQRWLVEREWYRNVLFYLGQQWITYEETFRRWRTRNLPRWVPLPVTNRLSSTVNVIRSSVAQITPYLSGTPTDDNYLESKSAAAPHLYLDVIMQESG